MSATDTFWDFSIRTYRCEGVPEACLALQSQHRADVNVLLFCCWMGATRGKFTNESYAALMAYVSPWAGNVVQPLRDARTWMKSAGSPDQLLPGSDYASLRERIKAVELKAEHLQQNSMQSLVDTIACVEPGFAEQCSGAAHNLFHYCCDQNIGWSAEVQAYLGVICKAAIPLAGDRVVAAMADLKE